MKKIIYAFLCSLIAFPAFAEEDLINYIYGKAMIGDVEGLRSLTEQGFSLEERDEEGNTPYCLAVFRRNQTAIRSLELAGANIRPRCLKSVPVVTEAMIYEAAHNRNVKQLTLWQEYGVPVDLQNNQNGNTALCQAVYEKDCPAIDILLKAGASEYHNCMRRIPLKVRQELDCRPVVIDWERVGLTMLGAGLVAGGVAVALSGGGSSGEPCAINQHWDGEKCVVCPGTQCWDGAICRVPNPGEYTNPRTNRCMLIAPPTFKYKEIVSEDFKTNEYTKGQFLQHINASDAYARGYSGYVVPRTDIFGALENEQQEIDGVPSGATDDEKKAVTDVIDNYSKEHRDVANKEFTDGRVVVAILSTGTDIKDMTFPGETEVVRYVNKDLAEQNGGTGEWQGNLAINSMTGKLFGYNFDYGYVPTRIGNTGSQDWYIDKMDGNKIKPKNIGDKFDPSDRQTSYYSGSISYFTGSGDGTQIYLVLTGVKGGECTSEYCGLISASDSTVPYQLVNLEECGSTYTCLAPPSDINGYIYTTDSAGEYNPTDSTTEKYKYTYDPDNPAPHYYLNITKERSWNQGTLLAGIVAALKNGLGMHGVAYNATVLPAVADQFRPITEDALTKLIKDGKANIILQDVSTESVNKYTIANYAKGKTLYSTYGTDVQNAYKKIASTGTIFVLGTGTNGNNTSTGGFVSYAPTAQDYQKDATISAGAPLTTDGSALKKLFLSVAAVQPDIDAAPYGGYTLTSYSQPCGYTAEYCLSAPGGMGPTGSVNLYSTSTTTSTGEYKWGEDWGTSAAAAVVAGAAAVLMSAYPHLYSTEVVALLKQTATPLGACAVSGATEGTTLGSDVCHLAKNDAGIVIGKYSELYGWGLVDLDAATRPVGELWVRDGNSIAIKPYIGVDYTITTSSLTSVSAMSKNLLSALPATFAAFDSFARPFAVNARALLSTRSTRREFDDDFKAFMHGRDVTKVEANDQVSMSYAPRTSHRSSQMKSGLMEMKVDLDKSNLGFYYTEDMLNSRGNYFERALNNPFVQIQEAYGAEAKYNLTSELSVGMGYATGKNGFLGDGDKHYEAPNNRISMVSTEAAYQATKSIMFKASYGLIKEEDSVLGMIGTGAFKTAGANTNFASAGVEIKPSDKFKLNLAYTYGWTMPNQTDGLMKISRLAADGFAAVAQYDLGSDNMLGLSVSSPLRVRSGRVAFDLPVGRSATDDTIYRETFTGSMKPTARELDFALFYRDALTEALTIQSELGVRLNPDHQRDADPDYRAMFGLKWDY